MSFSTAFGQNAVVDEAADRVLQQALLVGELEVHDGLVYGRLGRGCAHHDGGSARTDTAPEGGPDGRLGSPCAAPVSAA